MPDVDQYETIAASATAQVIGEVGQLGDFLERLIIIPATTGPGLVTLLDGSISIPIMVAGGTTTLQPINVHFGARSKTGPWKLTTGTNVSVIAVGRFTG